MEGDPAVTGRWGPSVIVRPAAPLADALDVLTSEALVVAGVGHWATGSLGSAHVTIRALEPWGTPASAAQLEALRRAVGGPITLRLQGVRQTDTAVLVDAVDVDGAADRLRARYAEELGSAGWLEDTVLGPRGRDHWYATIVHVAAPVANGLEAWIDARRDLAVGEAAFDAIDVCEWVFDGRRMVPEVLATVPLR